GSPTRGADCSEPAAAAAWSDMQQVQALRQSGTQVSSCDFSLVWRLFLLRNRPAAARFLQLVHVIKRTGERPRHSRPPRRGAASDGNVCDRAPCKEARSASLPQDRASAPTVPSPPEARVARRRSSPSRRAAPRAPLFAPPRAFRAL